MKVDADVRDGLLSVEEFRTLPEEDGHRLELSRGRVVREPAPGVRHGQIAFRFLELLQRYGKEEGLGLVLFNTGFVLTSEPATVRVPDVAFVSADRLPEGRVPDGWGEGAPDVVVEVVSSSNSASEMQRRALDYLDAGARLVWVADPASRTVTEYRSRSRIRISEGDDELEGGGVLPGLRARVERLFA